MYQPLKVQPVLVGVGKVAAVPLGTKSSLKEVPPVELYLTVYVVIPSVVNPPVEAIPNPELLKPSAVILSH